MGTLCTIIGLLLTATGITFGASALIADHRKHALPGQAISPGLAAARGWLIQKVRRPKPITHQLAVADSIQSQEAFGLARISARPPVDAPPGEQIQYLWEAVTQLREGLGQEREAISRDINHVAARVDAVETSSHTAVAKVEEMTRDVATGTVQRQLWGLVLVGLGSVITTLPALFGWA